MGFTETTALKSPKMQESNLDFHCFLQAGRQALQAGYLYCSPWCSTDTGCNAGNCHRHALESNPGHPDFESEAITISSS